MAMATLNGLLAPAGQSQSPWSDAGYGGVGGAYDPMASIPVENRGGAGLLSKFQRKPFVSSQRKRLNAVPLLVCLLLPCALFAFVFWISSFSIRYDSPWIYDLGLIVSGLVVLVFLGTAVGSRFKFLTKETERDPSWLMFLAISMILAFVVAYYEGDKNYKGFTRPYLDTHNLNTYTDIYPDRMRGQQLLDAGIMEFARGTSLDISKSEGWKDGSMYCVAPITLGNATLPTYDFWAVGTDCCAGNKPDFHCQGWKSADWGALRIMSNGNRGKYRLAVQQAEAAYGIRAVHPLFFEWMRDPIKTVNGWQSKAWNTFVIWIFAWLAFQAFCVVVAALAFARLGAP